MFGGDELELRWVKESNALIRPLTVMCQDILQDSLRTHLRLLQLMHQPSSQWSTYASNGYFSWRRWGQMRMHCILLLEQVRSGTSWLFELLIGVIYFNFWTVVQGQQKILTTALHEIGRRCSSPLQRLICSPLLHQRFYVQGDFIIYKCPKGEQFNWYKKLGPKGNDNNTSSDSTEFNPRHHESGIQSQVLHSENSATLSSTSHSLATSCNHQSYNRVPKTIATTLQYSSYSTQ